MFAVTGDRKLLIDYIGAGIQFPSSESRLPILPPVEDSLYMLWETEQGFSNHTLPSYIVLPEGQSKDFLAWASTFIGTIKPFTAFVRVIEWPVAQAIFEHFTPTDTSRLEKSIIGLTIGEGLARHNLINPSDLTIGQCRLTASYTVGRAFSVGLLNAALDSIMKRCYKILKENGGTQDIDIEEIYLIWVLVKRLVQSSDYKKSTKNWSQLIQVRKYEVKESIFDFYMDYILEACREIENNGDISELTWKRLSNNSELFFEMKEEMQSTRERRVLFFEKAMANSAIQKIEIPIAMSFIAAYLTFKVNPGSMTHCSLLGGTIQKSLPTALIWYGFISGLYSKSDLLGAFDCLGRRIIRDISYRSELFDQPTCDVSVDEFDVASSGENKLTYFRKYIEKDLKIEIYPHVSIHIPIADLNTSKPVDRVIDQKLILELGNSLERSFELYMAIKSASKAVSLKNDYPHIQNDRWGSTLQNNTPKTKNSFNRKKVNEQPSFQGHKKLDEQSSFQGKKKVIEGEQQSFFSRKMEELSKKKP